MAYSYIDYSNLTSAQQNGTFTPSTLQFVEPDDIYVSITVAATATSTILTSNQFTVTTSPSLVVEITDQALLPLAAQDTVRVGRATDIDDLARTFTDGSVLKASLFGIPLPLCSCGVIPVAASIRRHGASRAATTAFLLSTP